MTIKRNKLTIYIGLLIMIPFIVLGSIMFWSDLNNTPFSKDGSHYILYPIIVIAILSCIHEICGYYLERMIICENTITIYKIGKPVMTLSLDKEVHRIEIWKRKIGRKSNKVNFCDSRRKIIFSEGISDEDCKMLEVYFKEKIKVVVYPGFEK